jgi:hypothetical protein
MSVWCRGKPIFTCEAPRALKQRHAERLTIGAEEQLWRWGFVDDHVLGCRQAAVTFRDGSGLTVGVCGDEHADFARPHQILGVCDGSHLRPLRGGSDRGRVGERAQHIEIGPNDSHVCFFGGGCKLEHLGLALITKVRRVGARLLENCGEQLGRNALGFFEVDLDAAVRGFDVAARRLVFGRDDDRFHPHSSAGTCDAGRGFATPEDQDFLEHRSSIATASPEAPRGPA